MESPCRHLGLSTLAVFVVASVVVLMWVTGVAGAEERGHVFSHSFGAPGSGEGQFDEPWDLAVNEATDDIYVVDHGNSRVEVFHEGAAGKDEYVREFNGSGFMPGEGEEAGSGGKAGEVDTGTFEKPTQIAVDNSCHYHGLTGSACEKYDPSNGDVYVIDEGHMVIDKYTATGEYVGQITGSINGGRFAEVLNGVAVAPDGVVSVGSVIDGKPTQPRIFFYNHEVQNATCETCAASEFETGLEEEAFLGEDLAVNGEGDSYVRLRHAPLEDIVAEYSPVGEKIGLIREVPWGLAVEPSDNDLYLGSGEGINRFDPSNALLEQFGRPGLEGSGVAVDSTTGNVFSDDMAANEVDVFGLEPAGYATAKETAVLDVEATSVQVSAEVNPRGSPTTYNVEYGRCGAEGCSATGFESSLSESHEEPAGERFEPLQAHLTLTGLTPGVKYHLRLKMRNEEGDSYGEEVSFTTRRGGTEGLSDGRVWEQVSPEAKFGALLSPLAEEGVIQAAADGTALTYLASNPTELDPAGFSNAVQVIATRHPSGGWTSEDIATPQLAPTGKTVGAGQEYRFFSSDLSAGLAEPFGEFDRFSEAASQQTPYIRSDFGPDQQEFCAQDCYRPLVTGCPAPGKRCEPTVEALADVPAGTVFSVTGEACEAAKICGPEARAASSDLSAVVVESPDILTKGGAGGLYEWVGGALHYVGSGVLSGPEGVVWANDGGTRVVAGDTKGATPLRMVDPLNGESAILDAGDACGGCETGGGEDPWVAGEGTRVFYRDSHALTEGADRGAGAEDLYVCEVPLNKVECTLTDLTPKPASGHADVLGVVGVSEDGASLYFVANGALAPGAVHGDCSEEGVGTSGECNLYVMQRRESGWGTPRLVAVLSRADEPDWTATRPHHTAAVSGESLVFMSDRPLTAYDNNDLVSGEPDEEVYRYDPAGDGLLVCVSCSPTGERPRGEEYARLTTLASGNRVWPSEQWIAANVPGWTPFTVDNAEYQPRYAAADGRVFFDSSDDLVAGDVNSGEDVYQWEPAGVGTCSSGSLSFSEVTGGCVSLVSSGRSGEESGLLDASASGEDVFFLTSGRLVSGDTDNAVDVYDAHECSDVAPCAAESPSATSECESAEACQPYATVRSNMPTVASEVLSGFGNALGLTVESASKPTTSTPAQKLAKALRKCRGDRSGAKRRACEARARKEYGKARRGRTSRTSRARHAPTGRRN